jgi:hypothetical protein
MLFQVVADPAVGTLEVRHAELVEWPLKGPAMPLTCRPVPRAAELRSMGSVLDASRPGSAPRLLSESSRWSREASAQASPERLTRLQPIEAGYMANAWVLGPLTVRGLAKGDPATDLSSRSSIQDASGSFSTPPL